ncbi:Uncharacterized protein SCG7086_AJ_00150 [Chlamydiales bacterium SCGC AG-110-P3]|nr:Uncharacterized protein SCG7086_AJ_00150 [Chlamydiales bacterium SCGC AG-110-P3]
MKGQKNIITGAKETVEVRTVCLNTLLLLFLSVSQCVLSNLKDSVILGSHPDGVLAIAAIQVWGLLPGAIAISWLFAQVSSKIGHFRASYFTISGFLVYFLVFAFLLFPNREVLQLDAVGQWIEYTVPGFGKGISCCITHWVVSGFFIIGDLWGSAVIAVIFWGFINTRTAPRHAERQYGFLKIGATASALVAGVMTECFVQREYNSTLCFGATAWEQTLIMQILFVTGLGIASLFFLWILSKGDVENKNVLPKRDDKPRLALRECFATLMQSRYLGGIAVSVVGYAVVFTMSDLVWKHHLRIVYPDPNDLMTHLNRMLWGVGVFSLLGALSSGWLLRRFGWMFVAAAMPYVAAVTGVGLFGSIYFGNELAALCPSEWDVSPVWMVVYTGTVHIIFLKAFKFSLFDVSKELAFTPLESSVQWRGKMAIDGVGSYAGKTGTALLQQMIIVVLGGVMASTVFMGGAVFAMLIGWILSVNQVGHAYQSATRVGSYEVSKEKGKVVTA